MSSTVTTAGTTSVSATRMSCSSARHRRPSPAGAKRSRRYRTSSRAPFVPCSHHPVARDHFLVPGGAQLGRALLCREVHVMDAEPLAVAVGPFEIVHQAPQEITLERI